MVVNLEILSNQSTFRIIPEHSESNAAVDSFNRSLKNLVRAAKINQKHWQNELCTFLHSY